MSIPSSVAARFVAGPEVRDAIAVAARLRETNRMTALLPLTAEDTDRFAAHLMDTLPALAANPLPGPRAFDLTLSAAGLTVQEVATIVGHAARTDVTVTLSPVGHRDVDDLLALAEGVRREHETIGVAIDASLHRSDRDCLELAEQDARVRLLRRTESAPRSVAWQDPNEIDLAFARCLRALVPAPGYLAVATWQQRLIDVTGSVAALHDRDPATFEYTLPLGVRADEQRRIADAGQQLRVLVPYGPRWRPYVRERMAERPRAGVQAVWRSVRPRSVPIIDES